MPVPDNIIPLSDGAGEVIEVGAGVKRIKAGDKVAGCFFQRWPAGEASPDVHASALGGGIDGMLAEYVVLEEEGAVKIPAHLTVEEGATLPCAGVTAWHALVEHGRVIAGQAVLLQGTGGVSILGLQLAHAMGVQVIITSSSDEKLARAKKLGANHGINYKTTPDWEKAAKDFTGGHGVDQMVEVGGADTLTRSFGAIRVGGKISLIGGLSGPATELNPGLILARRANVQGISVGSTQMFEVMNRAIAANGIKPVIDKVFGFDEVQAAYKHMASGAHLGKIVIRVAA
jgi:NADPH:quinone reductase-like Zn-dependent oxidoreductase